MSFHFTSSDASVTREKSSPIASRINRSPSFSRRWISTRCGFSSPNPSKRSSAAAISIPAFARYSPICLAGSLIDWGDECAVDEVVNLMRRLVALVLEVSQPSMPALAFEQRLAELGQRLADEIALGSKQVVKPPSGCEWCEFHRVLREKAIRAWVKASLTSPLTFCE